MDEILRLVKRRFVKVELENIGTRITRQCKICIQDVPLCKYRSHEASHRPNIKVPRHVQLTNGHPQQNNCSAVSFKLGRASSVKSKSRTLRYQCQYCDKSFISPSQCRSHENALHTALNVVQQKVSPNKPESYRNVPLLHCEQPQVSERCNGNGIDYNHVTDPDVTPCEREAVSETKIVPEPLADVKIQVESLQIPDIAAEKEPASLTENPNMDMAAVYAGNGTGSSDLLVHEISQIGLQPNHVENGNYLDPENCLPDPPQLESIGDIPPVIKIKTEPGSFPVPRERKPFVAPPLENDESSSLIVAGDSRTCLHCYVEIPLTELFVHIKTHLMKGQKECSLCDYRAIASGDLRDHMNKHYNLKPYKCPTCGNSYGWQSGFKKHVQSHDKEQKNFKCTTCKLKFQTQRERRRHELTHKNIAGPSEKKTAEPEWQAPQHEHIPQPPPYNPNQYESYAPDMSNNYHSYQNTNAYQFDPNSYQPNHYPPQPEMDYGYPPQHPPVASSAWSIHSYDSSPAYKTDPQLGWNDSTQPPSSSVSTPSQGDEGPSSGTDLDMDVDAVEDEIFREPQDLRESETCKTCGLEIKMPDLPKHIMSHILPGQKTCRICKYKSQTGKYLEEHYNIHYNLKPFKCPICTRGFAMQSYLKSHTQQVHESNRRYQCRFCEKRFVRPCHQKSHEKVHEGQGEPLPPIPRGKPGPKRNIDTCNSDSNNSSSRPTLSSLSESNSGSSPSSHQHSSSPNLAPLTPYAVKSEPNWSAPPPPQQQWPGASTYWPASDPYAQHTAPPPNSEKWHDADFDVNNWNPASYYTPIMKTDVNWTATNNTHDHSWQNQAPPFQTPFTESTWSDPSSGAYTNTTPTPPPTSASVQDLWAELHYEELKLFPEATSTTVFTADGIPMTMEVSGLDVPSLPPAGRSDLTATPDTNQIFSAHVDNPALLHAAPGANWKPQGRAIAKSKTRVTAEVKHKMNMNKSKAGPERTRPSERPSRMYDHPQDPNIDYDDVNRSMTCQTCGEVVLAINLLVHIHAHLVPGQRTCDLCQRTYCNYVTLREHVHVHYDLRPHKCSSCTKRFNTKYSLKTHEAFEHEKGGGLQCSHCQKTFAMKSDLQKHLRSHGENGMVLPRGQLKQRRPTAEEEARNRLLKDVLSREWQVKLVDIGNKLTKKCVFCNEEILLRDYFQHKYAHTEPCYVCEKPVLVTDILYHGPTHCPASLQCEVCGWKSKQRSQLWEHMNGHNKQKPIRCVYCGVGFASRNSVRSHYLAIHTKFRPHQCRYCERSFVQMNTLKQHEITHFDSSCPICFQKFGRTKELTLHMRAEHKENLSAITSQ